MQAIIFDMDGVLVDSEPLWQKAEKTVFTSLGVPMLPEQCAITQRMTTNEVAKFWYNISPWEEAISIAQSEQMVIDEVIASVRQEECIIPGVRELIQELKSAGFKIGLATNSPYDIIPVVLNKLGILDYFDALCSAEQVNRGKPMPDVYLSALEQLDVKGARSLAIEDSNSGIRAAKTAGMKVAAFTNGHQNNIIEKVDLTIPDFSYSQREKLLEQFN